MSNKAPSIDLELEYKAWGSIRGLRLRLEKVTTVTLASLPPSLSFPCKMTLLLTDNKNIKQLNRDFRGLDKPTNVLSFPQFDSPLMAKKSSKKIPVYMGDIAISYQYVVAEAKKDHKILINHVSHLLIHGILHLFGYDHGHDSEAMRMERLEQKIMASLGLDDPYALTPAPTKPKTRKKAQ